ncbi:NAD(P)H-dependent flavin oxidoreductase [Tropicimonas isoalkanivorans]|uniref:2-nitropropane dioxygenase n=1 Tax=Tropicimonas isoalkanivorans TaxID=441112 RepID=A0A1I1I0E3_9RHOB|nr:nitronate monooxygenase family protein [Tropicimonas isoalkanivorans]SFC29272.1 2-nitropropane dioxygenase precursor [Tropicimonas isoalkanivorans]
MRTRITELLGIRHPVVQGGMQWVGRAELAAAVSNAGGLGIVTALTQPTPEDLSAEITRCRSMTDKPFGVNLTILPTLRQTPYDDYLAAALDAGVTVIETAGRSPEPYMERIKAAGAKVIHKCTSVRHALTAERIGVDAVSVDGFECAGHPGEDDVPNLILLPRAADGLSIPFLASGGIADGRGLAAALVLGADGVNMGTRFMATAEAPIHENVKRRIVEASELDTVHLLRPLRNTARYFRNSVAEEVRDVEKARGPDLAIGDVAPLIAGARGRKVYEGGDLDAGVWTAGLAAGLIHDIPTCEVLIERMVSEAEAILRARFALFE